jgi:hypothetical protein
MSSFVHGIVRGVCLVLGILGLLLYFILAVPEVFGDRSFCDAMPGNLDMQSL